MWLLTLFVVGAYFGPPPPTVAPLAIFKVALPLLLLLIGWVDRHRRIDRMHGDVADDTISRSTRLLAGMRTSKLARTTSPRKRWNPSDHFAASA
jgi:hypothetical protein